MRRFETLCEAARDSLERLGLPGASLGVEHEGAEATAGFGITSIEHPLEVDAGTLFPNGSIATARAELPGSVPAAACTPLRAEETAQEKDPRLGAPHA